MENNVIYATGTTEPTLGDVTYVISSGTVRKHEVLVFPGEIVGKVVATDSSAGTFTVTPRLGVDLPTVADTDKIYILGISTPEEE